MIQNKKLAFAATGAALMLASAAAQAQTAAQQAAGPLRGLAAATLQAPVAFGAGWGGVGIGVYGQSIDYSPNEDYDGSAGIAFGLGNPDKYVGLETVVSTSSLTGASGDDFGEAGSVGLKLHTNLPGHASFAVGVTGTGRWGNAQPGNTSSVYAVGTKFFRLGNTVGLVANLGLGDNLYQEPGKSGANVLGSLALYISPRVSIIGEYTGRFANAAVSAAPFRSLPLTVTLGAVNLGESHGFDTEFAGSVGLGFSF